MCPSLTPSSMDALAREAKESGPPAALPPIFRNAFLNFFSLKILSMALFASGRYWAMRYRAPLSAAFAACSIPSVERRCRKNHVGRSACRWSPHSAPYSAHSLSPVNTTVSQRSGPSPPIALPTSSRSASHSAMVLAPMSGGTMKNSSISRERPTLAT